MRNIGVIFILILIGMLVWKASEQENPAQSSRQVSAATKLEVPSDASPITSIDRPAPNFLAEKSAYKESRVVPSPYKDLVEIEPNLEKEIKTTKGEDRTGEQTQISKEFDRIIIPSLKVNAPLISKPYSELTWDLTDLEHNVATLTEIPYQTSENNIVLAGHVTVRDGSHGPFRYLWKLNPGDRIILKNEDYAYTYSVREQILVYPEENSVLEDTPEPQLTLITCTTWDEETSSYLRRRVIFADLESIEPRQMIID